ncbi:MAG: hypothetical protein EXR27_22560 [Betaproteobacteria bacterium]|nr:hypothetical protein [Betaproteobacteria bacterium]
MRWSVADRHYPSKLVNFRSAATLTFIHPHNDAAIIAGQGTVALEMLEQAPALEMLVVLVGGDTIAEGLAVRGVGELPLKLIQKLVK